MRLLPGGFCSVAELPGPCRGPAPGCRSAWTKATLLAGIQLDFAADPHFLVLGDTETGKSNLLHLIADGIVTRYSLDQARLIIVDYRRSLLDAADTEHRIGYAPSSAAAGTLLNDAREALVTRLPPADLTADQLRNRSWWRGSDLFLIVDDYDLVAGVTNPLLPLVDLLPQARDIGLHLVLARSAGGAGRAMFEPVIQRLREMGSTALLMSASKDEGPIFGVKPQTLPPGRGYLATRRADPLLVQTAFATAPQASRAGGSGSGGARVERGPRPGGVAAWPGPATRTTGPRGPRGSQLSAPVIRAVADAVRPASNGGVEAEEAAARAAGGWREAAWPGLRWGTGLRRWAGLQQEVVG